MVHFFIKKLKLFMEYQVDPEGKSHNILYLKNKIEKK